MIELTTGYQLLEQTYLGSSYGDVYIRIYAKYSEQDIYNNRTKVQYQARAYFSGNNIWDNGGSGGVSGTSADTIWGSCTKLTKGETVIATTETWVAHNADGTQSISASASLNFPNWGWNKSAWGQANLPKILRAATITDAPNFTDEDNPTITYSNPAGSSVTKLEACISLTGSRDDVPYREIPIDGTTYTFELTDEERRILLLETVGSNSREVIFHVRTEIGGSKLFSTSNRTFTVINGVPTLAPMVKDINNRTIELTGSESILVRNFSNAQVTSGVQVYKEASIKSQSVICGNQSLNEGDGVIESVGSGALIFSVTDNRENTVVETINVPFVEYVNLTCNLNISAPDADGDIHFSISGNCFNGSFGAAQNTLNVYYRYKVNNGEYGEWIAADSISQYMDNTYETDIALHGLDYTKRYTFQAMAQDLLMGISSAERIVKTMPVFDWGEKDFNFNVPIMMKGQEIKLIVERGIKGTASGDWQYEKYDDGYIKSWLHFVQINGTINDHQSISPINMVELPFAIKKPYYCIPSACENSGKVERLYFSRENSSEFEACITCYTIDSEFSATDIYISVYVEGYDANV